MGDGFVTRMMGLICGIVIGFLVGAVSAAFAQGVPPGPDFVSDVWAALKTAGPFGAMIMASIWWLERSERMKALSDKDALQERALKALNDLNTAMTATSSGMSGVSIAVNSLKDMLITVKDLIVNRSRPLQ